MNTLRKIDSQFSNMTPHNEDDTCPDQCVFDDERIQKGGALQQGVTENVMAVFSASLFHFSSLCDPIPDDVTGSVQMSAILLRNIQKREEL